MNLSLLIWMGVAVCLAWAVGAYSRLNRMREQVVRARASLLKHCKRYPELAAHGQTRWGAEDALAQSPSVITAHDGGSLAWKNLAAAIGAMQAPLAAWEAQPSSREKASALALALDTIQSGVDALASAPEDLAGALWPAEERARWVELVADVRLRRSRYNAYASEMNEAAEQMPATVIARLAGLPMWEPL